MKKIIIAGTARVGKATLAKKIMDHYHYDLIQSDIIACTMYKMYIKYMAKQKEENHFIVNLPELTEITDYVEQAYFNTCIEDYVYTGIILDAPYLSMEMVKEYENQGCIVIVLGCADITVEKFLENIRTYDTPLDRTYHIGNTRLCMELEAHLQNSKDNREECKKLGLTYIETSQDRQASLEKAYQIIKEKIENS